VFAFDVLGKRGLLFELSVAHFTLIRLLVCVCQLVSSQIVRTGELFVAGVTDVQSNFFGFHFGFFLFAVQQVLSQVSLGREGHITEATLSYGLLLVLVVAAHFADVLLEMREATEQAAALVTLERT